MQVVLSSAEISCEHCIETIRRVVEATPGASFVSGDPAARTFVVTVAGGAALDTLGDALAAEGYPLGTLPAGEAAEVNGAGHEQEHHEGAPLNWRPDALRIERTPVGANVNYDCYCGCDAGFAFDRAQAAPAPESCCCSNRILVGADAGARLIAVLDGDARYRTDVRVATMPWGQPLEVAIAIPLAG